MSEEGQTYTDLYSAVLKTLTAGSECDVMFHLGEVKLGPLDAAFIRHCFSLGWKLLGSLPTSVEHFKNFTLELEQQRVNIEVGLV